MSTPPPALIIVMGASGCGKSSVGLAVAKAIHAPFVDGDDLHPASNVTKMSTGTPLTDEVRSSLALLPLPLIRDSKSCAFAFPHSCLIITHESTLGTGPTPLAPLHPIRCPPPHLPLRLLPPLLPLRIHLRPHFHPAPEPAIVGALNVVHTESFPLPPADDPEFGEGKRRKVVVIGCSALKGAYRDLLRGKGKDEEILETFFIYLHGTRPLLLSRMETRPSHFFKASMLDSQLATLEPPSPSTEKNIGVVQLGEGEGEAKERGMLKVVGDSVELAKKWLA